MKKVQISITLEGRTINKLEELQDHFCADILPALQSGRLAKWFDGRDMQVQAEAIRAIDKNSDEAAQLLAVAGVLEIAMDAEDAQFMLEDWHNAAAAAAPAAASVPAALASKENEEETEPSGEVVDWSGQDMSNRKFVGADLRNANLKEVNFSGSDLSGADLSGADLSEADLSEADLTGALFVGANLRGANLMSATVKQSEGKTSALPVNFSNMDIVANWMSATAKQLEGKTSALPVNFSNANIVGADLSSAVLRDALFCGCNLTKASLVESWFDGADFSNANLSFADLSDARFGQSQFAGASLVGIRGEDPRPVV
ncbi:MAG: pentapeptide repeat-containing protein [Sideroxydans sp.]|nr:pentapeptide repeat-containing protein [Sideroxydans sp.]